MDKRGLLRFLVFSFFLLMFFVFVFLKSQGLIGVEITGFTTYNSFAVNESIFSKIRIGSGGNVIPIEGDFHLYDLIGCAFSYTGNTSSIPVDVGFYSEGNTSNSPNKVYNNVFNSTFSNFLCDEQSDACLLYYNVTESRLGEWRCFIRWGNSINEPEPIVMVNSPPVLSSNIPNLFVLANGSYGRGEPIDLDDYFEDFEDDDVVYGAVGQLYVNIDVDEDNVVSFDNPENYEGVETVRFRAHDGINGTFSNNVSVMVGSGIPDYLSSCSSVWDCEWTQCVGSQQVCNYFDRNSCGNDEDKPVDLVRSCEENPNYVSLSVEPLQLTGTLNIEKPLVSGLTRTLLIVGAVVIIMLILFFVGYLFFKHTKKTAVGKTADVTFKKEQPTVGFDKQGVKSNTSDLGELYEYIETALSQGQKADKIKSDLMAVGWQQKDIDIGFNFVNLKKFVRSKLDAGFDKQKISESLKVKGWKEELINSVFTSLGK